MSDKQYLAIAKALQALLCRTECECEYDSPQDLEATYQCQVCQALIGLEEARGSGIE